MNAINYSTARKNLASTMEAVCQDRDPVIITKNNDCAVVMISLADYRSMVETDYLLRSPKNAERLMKAMEAANGGKGKKVTVKQLEKLIDEKSDVRS